LNGPCTRDLTGTEIDGQYFTTRPNLLSEVEGWNAVAACDIENLQISTKM
jgi:hypothetical protein